MALPRELPRWVRGTKSRAAEPPPAWASPLSMRVRSLRDRLHEEDHEHDHGNGTDKPHEHPKRVGFVAQGIEQTTDLQHVHGRVHDDPHDVDEVPVDPGDLHAPVRLGRVVAAKRAGRDKCEEAQPDEHVRAVEPGQ